MPTGFIALEYPDAHIQRKERREEEVGPGHYEQEIETLKNPCGTAYSGV
jgi:hypothetical protein